MFKKQGRKPDCPYYHLISHGGLGDGIWVLKKAINFGKPLYVTISNEHRHRPRRSAELYEHVDAVYGWEYGEESFCPHGDWTNDPNDPACFMNTTWAEFAAPVNKPFRIECNRWIESGRRLDDWLPDLPTTHNFKFSEPGKPNVTLRKPCVVFHIAGWHDVPDGQWTTLIDLFRGTAHIYIVGGSYDHRPRQIYNLSARIGGVTLLEDVAWDDLVGVLAACDYCFGHASGFTAMADVMRVPGVVVNPRSVPRLTGTWNSPDNPAQAHVSSVDEFAAAVYQAYESINKFGRATWPPTGLRGAHITANNSDDVAAVKAAAAAAKPRRAAVSANSAHHAGVGAAVLDGTYTAGGILDGLHLVGCSDDAVAAAEREAARSSRRPVITVGDHPWPGGRKNEAFDLIVVLTAGPPPFATSCVREAWASLSARGTLLFGGPYAGTAAESLGSTLSAKPRGVDNAPGWYYLHRRN